MRNVLIESGLISEWILLLLMPTLALVIQCGLFLFGITCSPFPMWGSFLMTSVLALILHWKCLIKFWGLISLALLLTAYTYSYHGIDAEEYHVPMQLLLKNGWNPVFDSTLEKFKTVADLSLFRVYPALFLPKTAALCGALVARSTGLWIADSFLGYILFFLLFRISFVFAKEIYKCRWEYCLLFAATISWGPVYRTLLKGLVDYHVYAAQIITIFSLVLYLRQHNLQVFILAIMATAICCTLKTTGLVNCVFFWFFFGLYSWKKKETCRGILAVTLLVAWIGMSPLITSWIQYGSPLYPSMTFDPKIETVDLTADFMANPDGERMGYIARFIYSWVSPVLATKACSLYYHNADFNPVFTVYAGVEGMGKKNCLLWFSIFLLLLAKKNLVTTTCLFILITLVLYPIKYIGYARYFPQAWVIIPLGVYQFVFNSPAWLQKRVFWLNLSRYSLALLICIHCFFLIKNSFGARKNNIKREVYRQKLLADYHKNNVVFVIPRNIKHRYTLQQRLLCEGVSSEFSCKDIDKNHVSDDTLFPHFQQYYKSPIRITDFFSFIPHPIFCPAQDNPDSAVPGTVEDKE